MVKKSNNLIVTALIIFSVLLLPILLLITLIFKLIYKVEPNKDKKIEIKRFRLSNKIVSVSVDLDNMQKRLYLQKIIKFVGLFRRLNVTETYNVQAYSDFFKEKDREVINVGNKSLITIAKNKIMEMWQYTKKNGGDSYAIIETKNNSITIHFHNDCCIWVYATFSGDEKFLNRILKQFKVW